MKERMLKGSKKKSPIAAAVASAILPGAGQAYNREVMRAIILIILSLSLVGWGLSLQYTYLENLKRIIDLGIGKDIARLYAEAQSTSRLIPVILYVALVVFSVYDAYAFAAYIVRNIAVEVEKEEFNLPPKAERPVEGTSPASSSAGGADDTQGKTAE